MAAALVNGREMFWELRETEEQRSRRAREIRAIYALVDREGWGARRHFAGGQLEQALAAVGKQLRIRLWLLNDEDLYRDVREPREVSDHVGLMSLSEADRARALEGMCPCCGAGLSRTEGVGRMTTMGAPDLDMGYCFQCARYWRAEATA